MEEIWDEGWIKCLLSLYFYVCSFYRVHLYLYYIRTDEIYTIYALYIYAFFYYFSVSQDIRCAVHTTVQQFFCVFVCDMIWICLRETKRKTEEMGQRQSAGVCVHVCARRRMTISESVYDFRYCFVSIVYIYSTYIFHCFHKLFILFDYFNEEPRREIMVFACVFLSVSFFRENFFSMGGNLTDILCQFYKLRYYAVMVCGVTWCSSISFCLTHYHRHDLQQQQQRRNTNTSA